MIKTIILLLIILFVEKAIQPRLAWAKGDNSKLLILWYGSKKRNFIILWQKNN